MHPFGGLRLSHGHKISDALVEYGLVFNEKRDAVESVVFRSTKNGLVEKQVRGPAKDDRMTLRQVAVYAAEFSLLLKKMDEAAENSDSEYYFYR